MWSMWNVCSPTAQVGATVTTGVPAVFKSRSGSGMHASLAAMIQVMSEYVRLSATDVLATIPKNKVVLG